MELRTGFQKPFPESNILFLSDEELAALKFMAETACFYKESNIKLIKDLQRVLRTQRKAQYG